MELRDAVIVDTVRTPIGKRNGALAGWHPTDLLGHTLNALLSRTGVDPEKIDDVVGGNVTQVGEQGQRHPQRVGRRPACPSRCRPPASTDNAAARSRRCTSPPRA